MPVFNNAYFYVLYFLFHFQKSKIKKIKNKNAFLIESDFLKYWETYRLQVTYRFKTECKINLEIFPAPGGPAE